MLEHRLFLGESTKADNAVPSGQPDPGTEPGRFFRHFELLAIFFFFFTIYISQLVSLREKDLANNPKPLSVEPGSSGLGFIPTCNRQVVNGGSAFAASFSRYSYLCKRRFLKIWEAFIHRTPDLSLWRLKEQNTQMGHVAPAAFPAGLGLGLHPQPVPHPTLVGMLGVSTGPVLTHVLTHKPATGLGTAHLPLVHATGLHTVRPATRPRPCSLLEGSIAPCGSKAWVLP